MASFTSSPLISSIQLSFSTNSPSFPRLPSLPHPYLTFPLLTISLSTSPVIQRVGKKWTMVISSIIFALYTMLCVWYSYHVAVPGSLLIGLMRAPFQVAAYTYIGNLAQT